MDVRERGAPRGASYRNRVSGLVVATVAVLAVAGGATVWDLLHAPAGEAPAFALASTGYENGTLGEQVDFTLADYRGRTVVLDMMAVECTACRLVTKDVLLPLHAEFGNDPGFALLSIDTWADPETGEASAGRETREAVVALQMREGTGWRHALDTDKVWLKYQAVALPKIVVVDPDGRIVFEQAGQPSHAAVRGVVVEAMAGEAEEAQVVRLPLLGLAMLAGIAAFFAPCSVGLVPAYMGMLLKQGSRGAAASAMQTFGGGLAAALGVVSLYGVLALAFWQAGAYLQPHLGTIQVATGFILILVGLLMFRTGMWDAVARRLGMGRVDGRRGFFAFGAGFGLASFGCTGPAFLPILFEGFVRGPGTGFAVFALYGGALAALMLVAAGLVASGRDGWLQRLLSRATLITRISAALFVLAGAYVLWFKYRATGSLF